MMYLRRLLITCAALTMAQGISPAHAQNQKTVNQIVESIKKARKQIVIFTPDLDNKEIERALATSAFERGIPIIIVVGEKQRKSEASRLANLVFAGYDKTSPRNSKVFAYSVNLGSDNIDGFLITDSGRESWIGDIGSGYGNLKKGNARTNEFLNWVSGVQKTGKKLSAEILEKELLQMIRQRQ